MVDHCFSNFSNQNLKRALQQGRCAYHKTLSRYSLRCLGLKNIVVVDFFVTCYIRILSESKYSFFLLSQQQITITCFIQSTTVRRVFQ
jgi:hypothetical protein